MRRVGMLAGVVLVLAACGESGVTVRDASPLGGGAGAPPDSVATTTLPPPSSPEASTPDPTAPATTVTAPETTVASRPSTPSANEDLAIVAGPSYVVGWWNGSAWEQGDPSQPPPISDAGAAQVLRTGRAPFTATVTSTELDICGWALDVSPPLPSDFPSTEPVVVTVSRPLLPRPVREVDADRDDLDSVRNVLALRGVVVDAPVVTSVVAADLDGDGTEERIVHAEDGFGRESGSLAPTAPAGSYSIVLMRKQVEGAMQDALLFASVHPVEQAGVLAEVSDVAAIADLNDDGAMEVVVWSAYYEGTGMTVFEYQGDDLGPVPVMSGGCGV